MEGLVDAARQAITATVDAALVSGVCQEECGRLARYCLKMGLVLGELQLLMRGNEDLRGSKTVFLAMDSTASALRQAEQLVTQCAGTQPSSIWPLEDAVEFQGVAAELRSAAAGLAALGVRLPQDVAQDAAHVYRQFMELSFTEHQLSETEEAELERVQQQNAASPPQHTSVAAAAPPATAPAPPAAAAEATGALAPPAAPPHQFEHPQAALATGAVASSAVAAAAAREAVPLQPAASDAAQRRALQEAAAVATTAAAEVLSEGPGGEEDAGGADQTPAELQPEECAELEQAERAEEAAEAVGAAAGEGGVVLTSGGEVAMAPTAHAKGAVSTQGSSPLPFDPFEMSEAERSGLAIGTLKELKSFQRGQETLALADEAQRQLEASADNLTLHDQQAAAGGGTSATQALAALQQLQEYESAMGAGEEAEEAARAEEGVEAVPAGALTDAAAPMQKSRSQHATAVLTQNLAELATSEPEAQPKASPNGVEP
ncbi:hypothetical protein ABPG77_009408 [Micractinium sp. CCAP 211/92]